MIENNFLIELFLYFARFPKREGIYPMFNLGDSDIEGYDTLKSIINEMKDHSLTNIQNYIFGANLQAIKERVNNITAGSDYLFIDFGEIGCGVDSKNRMTDSASLAISVAYRVSNFSADLIEQTLAFSRSLDNLVIIRNKMIQEQKCHPWMTDISDEHTFVPFVAEDLNSLGWTLMFNREGYDSFDAKKP